MTTHYLKIEPQWLERVIAGEKRCEVRRHDRDFRVGDQLVLVSAGPNVSADAQSLLENDKKRAHTKATITHVLTAVPGIDAGYVVLSIQVPKGFVIDGTGVTISPDRLTRGAHR